ncbi:hypothetical protein [Rubritalea tangerina]|uniref:hypothetical protein n=1 Tax=Rubritalea tangerina TaxID=430798 RepID=UPI003618FEB3
MNLPLLSEFSEGSHSLAFLIIYPSNFATNRMHSLACNKSRLSESDYPTGSTSVTRSSVALLIISNATIYAGGS